jgi:hypothetical protein
MYRRGRPVVPDFDADEELYRRCLNEHADSGHLLPAAIGFRNWSVNRQRFSEPGDVLIPDWPDWGVAAFQVSHVLPAMQLPGGPQYTFRAEHVPDEDNYAHSEIRTYKDGVPPPKPEPPQEIKKKFRQLISDGSRIVIPPKR